MKKQSKGYLLFVVITIFFFTESFGQTSQTISFADVTKIYGVVNFSPATASSGLQVTYTSNNPAVATIENGGTEIKIVGIGSASITAYQNGSPPFNAATPVTRTLTVNKAPLIVQADNISKIYGDPNPTLTISYSGFVYGEGVSVLKNLPTATTTALINSPVNTLGYPITVSGATADNYQITHTPGVLTIVKAPLIITAEDKWKKAGDINPTLTYKYSGFKIGDTDSKVETKPSISTTASQTSPAGIYPITLSGGASTNYSLSFIAGKLYVRKNQTINFPDQPVIPYTTPPFSPATASSGLPVMYFSTNQNVISIVDGELHVTGVGECYVVASQDGNDTYLEADNVSKKITVIRATQTIAFSNITKSYGDPEFDPGAFASSGLSVTYTSSNSAVAIPTFDGIKIVGAGVAKITATQSGNSFYLPASKDVTLTVNKIGQTITYPALSPVDFGYPDLNPGATSSSNLPVIYSSDNPLVATIVNNLVHIVGAGIANIKASQAGNNNYFGATDVSQVLTVNKSSQIITFTPIQSKTYGAPDFTLTATSSSGLPVTFSSSNTSVATVSGNTVHITGGGTTIITASQSGNANYFAATSVTQTFTVGKSSQNIIFNSIPEKAISSPDFSLTATSSSGLPVTYVSLDPGIATVTNGVVHIVKVGEVYIRASQVGNTNYYAAASVEQKLVIKDLLQAISFAALPAKTFGDADFSISATASSGLPVSFISDNTSVAIVTNNTVKIIGAGTANIYALQAGNTNYAAATPVLQQLVVNKASQSIIFPAFSAKMFGNAAFPAGASATSGLVVEYTSSNPAVAQVIDGVVNITGVGSTTITASQEGNSNYLPATSSAHTLDVQKGTQTITFNAIPSKSFGDPDFVLDATATSGLPLTFISSDLTVATIINNKVHIVGAGSCTITATQPGDEHYDKASEKFRVLTVQKISQTISFDELAPVTYGSAEILLQATSTSGLQVNFSSSNNSIVSISNGYANILNTGSVYITASQSGNTNYNQAIPVSRLLVINRQDQIILFDSIPEKTYGDADFNLTCFASSGLPVTYMIENSNVAVMKNGKIHINGAGSTKITAKQNGNNIYNATLEGATRTLTVSKATLTVTPVKSTRKYMEPDPVFSATYFGFMNGETSAVIDIPPTIKSNTDINSLPGTYDLIASGGTDKNYTFNYNKGIFIVLGTTPLKPATPTGNEKICVNPGTQEYKTSGAFFGATYIWSVSPASAGKATASGKTLSISYDENFTGKVAISVKSENNQGISESSDTLYVNVLDIPQKVDLSLHGVYCSTNSWADTIKILESQNEYVYQLNLNGTPYRESLTGDGGMIYWGDLREGNYSITETVCHVPIAEDLKIVKADPSSSKPQLELKWNDVVICRDKGDSIESYQWFKDGILLPGETSQYIWTQKQEGYYSVSTTDITGCLFSSDSIWIEKQATGKIFPNPNNGNFKLSFSGNTMGKVLVRVSGINSNPVKILNFNKEEELFETDISIPELKTGIYYVEVMVNEERVFYNKFIRE